MNKTISQNHSTDSNISTFSIEDFFIFSELTSDEFVSEVGTQNVIAASRPQRDSLHVV